MEWDGGQRFSLTDEIIHVAVSQHESDERELRRIWKMKERTLSIIKPDGVSKNLMGEVIKRLEGADLKIVAMKMIRMTKEQAKGFYKVHEGKPFYESVTDFMSSGPCVVMVLEGDDVIRRYRKLMGSTNYREAELGTIRKDFATDIEKNVVHGSDSRETALSEISYFFCELEIMRSQKV